MSSEVDDLGFNVLRCRFLKKTIMEITRRRRYDKRFLTGYMVMYSYNRRNMHIQDSRRLYYFVRENK